MNACERGDRTESLVLSKLVNNGKVVSVPFGKPRYDFVLDDDGQLFRVQCKTGRIVGGALRWNACSQHCRTNKRKGYRGSADLFIVYCPELDKYYRIAVDAVPETHGSLRISPAKNGQYKNVKLAADFELR